MAGRNWRSFIIWTYACRSRKGFIQFPCCQLQSGIYRLIDRLLMKHADSVLMSTIFPIDHFGCRFLNNKTLGDIYLFPHIVRLGLWVVFPYSSKLVCSTYRLYIAVLVIHPWSVYLASTRWISALRCARDIVMINWWHTSIVYYYYVYCYQWHVSVLMYNFWNILCDGLLFFCQNSSSLIFTEKRTCNGFQKINKHTISTLLSLWSQKKKYIYIYNNTFFAPIVNSNIW